MSFLIRILLLLTLATALCAQQVRYPPVEQEIPGPPDRGSFAAWLADIQHWRRERLVRIRYDGSQYDRPELKWTQKSFVQSQMMVEDRYFYDLAKGTYTVNRYLDDVEKRYGGIDSVLIWHVYPNIGIDDRNQNDLLRDMPGGIRGLRQMVADFHRRGVKVLFPVMPWDQGTRGEGVSAWMATAQLLAEIGADGLNGDTMLGVPRAYREASDQIGHPLALEPELRLESDQALAWNHMGWGYWKYAFIPTVSRYKWIEPRHMVHLCRRWARDKTDDLQHAFFNGVGFESWENVWGIWNQLSSRDGEALRRVAMIERQFADLTASPDWEPHTPTLQYGVFASKFPSDQETLWTVVNRNEYDVRGQQIAVPHRAGVRYYDVWKGAELKPEMKGDHAILSFEMEAQGFAALFASPRERHGLPVLLAEMKELAKQPLSGFSRERPLLSQQLAAIPRTELKTAAPPGMIRIPAATFEFRVSGIEIEGSNEIGVDVQYPWENSPRRHHLHTIAISPYFMDKYPVTNAQFKQFIDVTKYHPIDDHNFLRHWKDGTYPNEWGNKPVIWVSLEDARACCRWAGKRLPHEWEWQYAAQGTDGRLYPWGNVFDAARIPPPQTGRAMTGPADVNSHEDGASPFGVRDMVGNVWQWTDEFVDDHTRAAILRGGSYYQPQGSHWYFPQAHRLSEHGKYLLMAPSKDRSAAVGFRCVVDAQ